MKTRILTLLAMVTLLVAVDAQTKVRITGATAFRQDTWNALNAMLPNNTGPGTANRFTFYGEVKPGFGALSGQNVEVYCSFSGSAAGIADLINDTLLQYQDINGELFTAGPGEGPHFAFSDVFQAATPTPTPPLNPSSIAGQAGVGVIPFTWAANADAVAAGINNITDQIVRGLLANGEWPLSFFTGKPADAAVLVNVTGRNPGSGTRITTLAETRYGIFTQVQQKRVVDNAWVFFPFNDGHSSGSGVRSDLNNAGTGQPAVGYISVAEIPSLTGGAQPISYNGVPFTEDGVREGSYTFWSYQQLYYKGALGALELFHTQFLDALNDNLISGIRMTDMNAGRNADGGPVSP